MNRIEWLRKLVEEERWDELSMALIDNEGVDALLDLAEAAKKVPGEWVQSVEFSDWIEAQIIVADLDEKLLPLLEEIDNDD